MIQMRSIARLAAMGGLCLLGFAARAEVPANGQAYLDASLAAVESMSKVRNGKATLPRLADPVEGKVLDDVWNEQAILGKRPYVAADIPALLDIVQKQARLMQIYAQFSPDGKPADQARNKVNFQDELTRSHVFKLKAAAAALEAIGNFDANLKAEEKTDARLQGLRQMRFGLLELVSAAALALREPSLTQPNQLLIARAFAENASAIVGGLAQADRQALAGALQAADPVLKTEAKKPISDFVKSAASAPCVGLCKLN